MFVDARLGQTGDTPAVNAVIIRFAAIQAVPTEVVLANDNEEKTTGMTSR
ncbi:MAG: hypothetical protein MI741_14430 [Rhodospirillales bacterium]|nr:hypothetical protein [Rhodospirillales bacterium]